MSARGRPKSGMTAASAAELSDEAILAEVMENPEVCTESDTVNKWSERVLLLTQRINGCTAVMQEVSTTVEVVQNELTSIDAEAQALTSLDVAEYKKVREANLSSKVIETNTKSGSAGGGRRSPGSRPTSSAGSVGGAGNNGLTNRNSRVSIFSAADLQAAAANDGTNSAGGEGNLYKSLESALTPILSDERKVTKVINFLNQYYSSYPPEELKESLKKGNYESPTPPPFSPDDTSMPPSPPTESLASSTNQSDRKSSTKARKSTIAEQHNALIEEEKRKLEMESLMNSQIVDQFLQLEGSIPKPKDIPARLWTEIRLLRARRLFIELNDLAPNLTHLKEQNERLCLLEENYKFSVYALEAASSRLQRLVEENKIKVRQRREARQKALNEAAEENKNEDDKAGKVKKKK